MLSKEQLEKRIAEIRRVAGELKWSSVEHSQIALRDAEALEEMLSLREQIAELKALEPIGQIVLSDYDSDGTRTARVVCLHDQADWDNFQDGTLLFTAAKPAED
ncbi:Uncharacterised protein [Yersinia pseudotuberculosis]|uniref:hypothetical protein n=1 Tax=Yersinia pseudotuberculosis TaxID=633 RepID=UPI0005DE8FA0|nr:hypothetical protein [Yersinia pseudotuberculosis]CNL19288.1 Uncharacterised protein [Yersinia pseudotuberculosis]